MKQSFTLKQRWITLILTYITIFTVGAIAFEGSAFQKEVTEMNVVIPDEAIRLRILPNSDADKDQEVKRAIRDEVNLQITQWVQHLTDIEESRLVLQQGLPELKKIAERVMKEHQLSQDVTIEFGPVEFPTKLYGNVLYPAGTYEAVLITLGEGQGANWWCVLYPPLCFVDMANGAAVSPGFAEDQTAREVVVSKEEIVAEMDTAMKPTKEVTETPAVTEKTAGELPSKPMQEQAMVVQEQEEEVQVSFFVVEMFKKFF
ncbi:stage II sporulation protein R [Mangrovibacillus cuniculi]|uniref:Stage II sporulation protein R n=1 Tax=Mangrovibacillus cuniculi TaxID=2593652 RepID=A0A7S8HGM7_9BACI|nr:stage II sporulation protein R [Mangrovibacillus cuniculi]QPC47721.1 stage II sporulation protein R [Mangrovibacillus cuniculi]